jgi:para-aminobenzoate synthetase component 1
MEIIQELETSQRGPYCGSVFYWDAAGRLDSNIAIRTLRWISGASAQESDQIECWAGGGIVADSTKEEEYAECFHKVQNLLDVLSLTLNKA